MSIRVVQLGSPRHPAEGLRIGTVRRPPRGVPKDQYAQRDFYDVWLPNLAPSEELMKEGKTAGQTDNGWKRFVRKYRAEMETPEKKRLLELLAALSHTTNIAVGCYCSDETRCHRSVLQELLTQCGARMHPPAPADFMRTANK